MMAFEFILNHSLIEVDIGKQLILWNLGRENKVRK
jgi:hypothetical protein